MTLDDLSRNFVLPRKAVPFVLLQRAETSIFERTARRHRTFYQRFLLHWEARLFSGRVACRYRRWIQRDFESIRPFLPEKVQSLCDVGCGVAGIDVLVHRYYGRPADLRFHLVDSTSTADLVTYGYKEEAEFYNSLEVAVEVLNENGVPHSRIRTHEASSDSRLPPRPLDLIVSLLSWGFHYPVATYLDAVHEALPSGGHVILDIRDDTAGAEMVRQRFGNFHDLGRLDNGKGRRIGAVKE